MRTFPPIQLPFLLAFSLLPGPARALDDVGINAHLAPDDYYDAAADLGVSYVRIDNNWLVHEPADGRYDWAELDRVVNRIVGHGQRVYMTIAYTPAWAAEAGQPGDQTSIPRAGLYERYVTAVVERYRDRVQHYGLWNEANLEQFWNGSAVEYADRIVTPGSAAIHAACPNCLALGPDLAAVGDWQRYLEQVFQRAGAAFDIVSHHTYAKPAPVHSGWICDDFAHAIDNSADPVCFYKPGLRQIMDEFASTRGKEAWLTETGYRADPWDSDEEQLRQTQYVNGVLDLQLQTPFWTNTFFYELVDCRPIQPDCEIDGFGILRRTAGPDDSWEDNFEQKPVYQALRARLAAEPELRGEAEPPPPPPPAPRELGAGPHADDAPDADNSEFRPESCVVLPDYIALNAPRIDATDQYASVCAGWSRDALYLGVEVIDEVHDNQNPDDTLWLGDSLQIAVDVLDDAGPGVGYGPDDSEITVGHVGGVAHVNVAPGVLPTTAATARRDDKTIYEVRIGLPGRAVGQRVHVSFLVNDADGAGRDGWLEWTPGIGLEKRPSEYGYITLEAGGVAPADGGGMPPVGDAGQVAPGADAAGQGGGGGGGAGGGSGGAPAGGGGGSVGGEAEAGGSSGGGAGGGGAGGGSTTDAGPLGAADILNAPDGGSTGGGSRGVSTGCAVGRGPAALWPLALLFLTLVARARRRRPRRPSPRAFREFGV